MKTLTALNMYKEFPNKKKVSYFLFREILSRFNREAINQAVNAKIVQMGNMGYFCVKKIKRSPGNRKLNWGKCEKDENGKIIKKVYWDDDYYLRFAWMRRRGKHARFKQYYALKIARRATAREDNNLTKLSKSNFDDPFLHLFYYQDKPLAYIISTNEFGVELERFNNFTEVKAKYGNNAKKLIYYAINNYDKKKDNGLNQSRKSFGVYWRIIYK